MSWYSWVLDHPVAALVVVCEVAFWVFLAAAVVARYVLHRRRLSTVLLLCEPAVEVVLLGATVGDLVRGSQPQWSHGLAALYLGYTVVFGRWTVHHVDAWVAWRWFGGPEPERAPRHGRARLAYEWQLWLGVLRAWAVAVAILGGLMLVATGADQRAVLLTWVGRASFVLVVWLVTGPVWQLFADGGSPAQDAQEARAQDARAQACEPVTAPAGGPAREGFGAPRRSGGGAGTPSARTEQEEDA